ncbi:MAG: hypothetical protein ACK4YF_06415, partial [Exilispira sp.]
MYNKKNFYLFIIFFILFLIFAFNLNVNAQFSINLGYNYVNIFSTINTSFLPYIGLSYNFKLKNTTFFIYNSFSYSLDNFFINRFNIDFSFLSSSTLFKYYIYYIPFNLFLVNNNYYSGNLVFTKFQFQNFNKVFFDFSFSAEYDQLDTNILKSPLNFDISTVLSIPLKNNLLSTSLDIKYLTDQVFYYSLLKGIFSTKLSFFPTINEIIIPKLSITGGYSFNNTSGNFLGFSISNLFYSSLSNKVSFSSELLISYINYLSSVLPDDIDYSQIKENILITIKYSPYINSSHSFNIRLLYFPQDNIPSNLNRSILEFTNNLSYSSSNIFILDFLSSIEYTYYFLQNSQNKFKLFFELIIKFLPGKNLSL